MEKSEVPLIPVSDLVVVRQVAEISMPTLVKAAKLFLEGKTGDDAFVYVHREPLAYMFVQPGMEKLTLTKIGPLWAMWCAAGSIFGEKFKECPDKENLLPYLLTMLCGDLLDKNKSSTVSYSADECGYSEVENGITIKLSKSKDYCSYHNLTATFNEDGFTVEIDGCWHGSQQDPGPVYHPAENCYKGYRKYSFSNPVRGSRILSGKNPEEAFALWGIDLLKMKGALEEAEQATA